MKLSRESPSAIVGIVATVIEHLINMAHTCYRHNDMHCALSITLALKSTPIKRLTKTWDSVDRRVSGGLAWYTDRHVHFAEQRDGTYLESLEFRQ